ncbi:uncharacterized protein KY384_004707 [Bacidia gigantensis]|uniref:uncharacterized protein n=1 Tax=Bacidia gigantensis TaxID=2732470 RepID=UPI001D057F76|nr:uncharacterized protein KY384_004707 [Bacidia gigantensis]KAG8530207.1 hypothetical protein KY384_004707 [Bacidia gigantensis]
MHLLNTTTYKTRDFLPNQLPAYIILSHRWGEEEVLFKDLSGPRNAVEISDGWIKLKSFCSIAKSDGWEWVWMDTCCIDKRSSAELSEAINSMYQWYSEAAYCVAYLADITVFHDEPLAHRKPFRKSEWFERGWTLQELLASHRVTSRPEDIAYCLLGLFSVNMPLLYGEGQLKAFQRLQYEIYRSTRDESLFAWTALKNPWEEVSDCHPAPNLLASSPRNFLKSARIIRGFKNAFPHILFDGMTWTINRKFNSDKDPFIPLACSSYNSSYPVKLSMRWLRNKPLTRIGSTEIEFLSKSEWKNFRSFKGQTESYHIMQQAPRTNEISCPWGGRFGHTFTLQVSDSGRRHFSDPFILCSGVQLCHGSKELEYIVSKGTAKFDDTAGIGMKSTNGVVVTMRFDSVVFTFRHLLVKIGAEEETDEAVEYFALDGRDEDSDLNLGDRLSAPIDENHCVSLTTSHGRSDDGDEVRIHLDVVAKDRIDLAGILGDSPPTTSLETSDESDAAEEHIYSPE